MAKVLEFQPSADPLEKTLMLGKIQGGRRRGRQDEIVGWHHRFDGHRFEQALGVGDGQGSLACCSLWGHKESDTTKRLKRTSVYDFGLLSFSLMTQGEFLCLHSRK